MVSLQNIAEHQDVFQRHLLAFLSKQDVGRLQSVSKGICSPISEDGCWEILCQRDFGVTGKEAPEHDAQTRGFGALRLAADSKKAYQRWSMWERQTCGAIQARHMIEAIDLWSRCKNTLRRKNLTKMLESFEPPPSREFFQRAADSKLPSSLLAFYAVHGGQTALSPRSSDVDFFAGLFGSFSCYDYFYSMRLLNVHEFTTDSIMNSNFIVGINLGMPRTALFLDFGTGEGPEGSMYMGHPGPNRHLVCSGGVLSYFRSYVERLERGVYQPKTIHPEASLSRGICLFPETGDMVSVAVTNGVEVRASARWFPGQGHGPMCFGYSIRIRLAESDSPQQGGEAVSYQLVDRNWEFRYEDGTVNRVQGEGVVGKQPLLFRRPDGTTGFIDLGPAGDGETYIDTVFSYQSQSGPVPGTSSRDVAKTTNARVRGTFGFRPGGIDTPTGPLFFATVAEFPLRVTLPFY